MTEPGYGGDDTGGEIPPRAPRDPGDTLRLAMLTYIAVNLMFGVPLVLAPGGFLDVVGAEMVADPELGVLRWIGAMLLAWGLSAILVFARPVGRAYFVTVGALQMTFAAAALLFSWWVGEGMGSVWFEVLSVLIFVGAAGVLWWARLRARVVLRLDPPA